MNNGKVCVNTGGGAPNICSSSNYNDGQWHHAVGIKNNGCIELYVDNQFEGGFVQDGLLDMMLLTQEMTITLVTIVQQARGII